MATTIKRAKDPTLIDVDLEPYQRWLGVPFGGAQPKEPFVLNDFRRWVTHSDNYNPLHWDDEWAAESRFGQVVAPQSYQAIRSIGELGGVGKQSMQSIHASEEIHFYGPRVYAGDLFRLDRVLSGVRATQTRYGPSAFITLDITYGTARGIVMKKQATTLIQPTENLLRLGEKTISGMATKEPEWTDDQIEDVIDRRFAYIKGIRTHGKRLFGSVKIGDKLERYILGPHNGASILYAETLGHWDVWGATHIPKDQPPKPQVFAANYTEDPRSFEKMNDPDRQRIMPRSRGQGEMAEGRGGHIYSHRAVRRGMPRAFGVGTMETVWATDYLANWAGEWGFLRHMTIRYVAPILSGDLTYVDGVVTDLTPGLAGSGTVHVSYTFEDQNGVRLAVGNGELELPLA